MQRWYGSPRLLFLLSARGPRRRQRRSGRSGSLRGQVGGLSTLGQLSQESTSCYLSEMAAPPSDYRDPYSHDGPQASARQIFLVLLHCFRVQGTIMPMTDAAPRGFLEVPSALYLILASSR